MRVANPRFKTRRSTKTAIATHTAVLVFVKSPKPGACKTRLATHLNARRTARIYRAMTERVVAHAVRAAPDQVWLLCSPNIRHEFFKVLKQRYGAHLVRQAGGSLGRRMHLALVRALAVHHSAVLIGSDQPDRVADAISDASAHLGPDCPAWLAPTVDGGYWGIGLTRPARGLFHGPTWSTSRVAVYTRTRLQRAGLPCREYPIRRDIDDIRDWYRLDGDLRARLSADAARPARGPR